MSKLISNEDGDEIMIDSTLLAGSGSFLKQFFAKLPAGFKEKLGLLKIAHFT
jgi:hypothetical protein